MSLAIRKRSWEEHVTQWMPSGSLDYSILCRHGLIADNVQAGMENDGIRSGGQKEKRASLPDCCYDGELVGFPAKLLGNVSKEVDENDNHQEEEEFFSLEDSTETLVSVSLDGECGEDDKDMNLSLEKVNHRFTHDEVSSEKDNLEGAGLFMNVEPREEAKEEWHHISGPVGKINEPNYETVPKPANGEEESSDSRGKNLGLPHNNSFDDDAPKENVGRSPNLEKNMPGEKEAHATVAGQQCERSDAPKDGTEKSICSLLPDEFSLCQCVDKNDQTSSVSDSSNYLVPSPDSGFLAEENNMDQNGLADSQDKCITSTSLVGSVICVKNNMATQDSTDGQVILRKRKEVREGRDQSRLDSMVLLILKLDQLDQDIENALSSGSSPSSTPTHTRRHIPDLELHPESGVNTATLSHPQTNVLPPPSPPPPPLHTYGADRTFPVPMAGSGAKPKTGAMPIITEKEKAGQPISSDDCMCEWAITVLKLQTEVSYHPDMIPNTLANQYAKLQGESLPGFNAALLRQTLYAKSVGAENISTVGVGARRHTPIPLFLVY